MSSRRASLPPPLPPLRARPVSPSLSLGSRPAGLLAAPSRSRRGQNNHNETACTTCSPFPSPSPASRPSVHVPPLSLRAVSVRTARCPLPLPAGAFNHINSYLSTQLLCVRPTLTRTIFFFLCSVIHLVPSLASLRSGPRRAPSQRFCGWRTP